MNVLTGSFSDLSDPREDGKVIYPLTDILVIATVRDKNEAGLNM